MKMLKLFKPVLFFSLCVVILHVEDVSGLTKDPASFFKTAASSTDTLKNNPEWSDTTFINQDIFIPDSVTLTIHPGAYILFNGYYQIKSKGQILAHGTPQDSIFFKAAHDSISWAGIRIDTLDAAVDSSLFEYCVFQDGKQDKSLISLEGGLFSIRKSDQVRISHSTFKNNYASHGGAIFIESSNIKISYCTFADNSGSFGGAAFFRSATPILLGNNFRDNAADNSGGAVYMQFCNDVIFTDNVITNNRAATQGGALACTYSSPVFINCTVYENNSSYGGAVYAAYSSSVHASRSTFDNNTAIYGGAFFIKENSELNITNSLFRGNSADNSGGVVYLSQSSLKIYNSLCDANIAGYGGSFTYTYGHVFAANNTFVNNRALIYGGSIYHTFTNDAVYMNNIFWNNTADSLGNQVYFMQSNSAEFRYCLIQGDRFGFAGDSISLVYENNISSDPFFTMSGNLPYTLQSGSPALEAGTPDTTGLSIPPYDLNDNPRILFDRIDIGAYEGPYAALGITDEKSVIPASVRLLGNYPNPFNPLTIIAYELFEKATVRITIFNALGEKVKELVNVQQDPGYYTLKFDGTNMASGIYFYQLQAGSFVQTKKMVLLQ